MVVHHSQMRINIIEDLGCAVDAPNRVQKWNVIEMSVVD